MGVHDLWSVLEPAGSECCLKDLKGLKLAVDTSVWLFQGQVAGKHIHLRTTFWRVHGMIRSQIRPVFVTEGPTHPLKGTRGQVNSVMAFQMKECCQLLKALGVPVIESAGEGEATCAALDHLGLVDGVVTEDSDAFLFGATVVYRQFSCDNRKAGQMKRYTMEDIRGKLKLDRRRLVAYALMVGCDFTDGIPGVGKAGAVKLLESLSDEGDILERFDTWRDNESLQSLERHRNEKKPDHCRICAHAGTRMSHKSDGCGQCNLQDSCTKANDITCNCDWHQMNKVFQNRRCELDVWTKAKTASGFPDKQVIDTFLEPSELGKLTDKDKQLQWSRPKLSAVQEVLRWASVKDVLEMVTAYDMAEILRDIDAAKDRIRPDCVLKVIGTEKVHVKWQFVADFAEETDALITTEDYEVFEKCFPQCLQTFLVEKERKAKDRASQASLNRKRKRKAPGDSTPQKGQSAITDHFKLTKK